MGVPQFLGVSKKAQKKLKRWDFLFTYFFSGGWFFEGPKYIEKVEPFGPTLGAPWATWASLGLTWGSLGDTLASLGIRTIASTSQDFEKSQFFSFFVFFEKLSKTLNPTSRAMAGGCPGEVTKVPSHPLPHRIFDFSHKKQNLEKSGKKMRFQKRYR